MDWSGASALKAEGDAQERPDEAPEGGPLGAWDTAVATHGSEAPDHGQGNEGASAAGSATVPGQHEAASESPRSGGGSAGSAGAASAGGVGVGVGSLRRLGLAPQLAELSLLVTSQTGQEDGGDGGEAEEGEDWQEGEEGREGNAWGALGTAQGTMQQQQQQLRMQDVSQEEYDRAEARLLERVYDTHVNGTGDAWRAGDDGSSDDDEAEEGEDPDDDHIKVGGARGLEKGVE